MLLGSFHPSGNRVAIHLKRLGVGVQPERPLRSVTKVWLMRSMSVTSPSPMKRSHECSNLSGISQNRGFRQHPPYLCPRSLMSRSKCFPPHCRGQRHMCCVCVCEIQRSSPLNRKNKHEKNTGGKRQQKRRDQHRSRSAARRSLYVSRRSPP